MGDSSDYDEAGLGCSSFFCFPSCGWVLRSEELFLKTREAKFLLVRKSLISAELWLTSDLYIGVWVCVVLLVVDLHWIILLRTMHIPPSLWVIVLYEYYLDLF